MWSERKGVMRCFLCAAWGLVGRSQKAQPCLTGENPTGQLTLILANTLLEGKSDQDDEHGTRR